MPRGRAVEVSIASRQGNDKTEQFPKWWRRSRRWGRRRKTEALFDGEIVALDAQGQPIGFGGCRNGSIWPPAAEVARLAADRPVAFVAFDLLRDGGDDLGGLALAERRGGLEAALAGGGDGPAPDGAAGARRRRGADGRGAGSRAGRGSSPRTRARSIGRGGGRWIGGS